MPQDQSKTTFDELVAGISSEERKFLLTKLNGTNNQDMLILQSQNEPEDSGIMLQKFKHESLLYRFLLWFRSVFSKRQVSELYNEDLILGLAKKVCRGHPGLLDQKNNLLLSIFYEKLKELKSSADFFKPYFQEYNDNPGKFYVFLSTFISPDISKQITETADPYTVPFDREATSELRSSLLKRMDAVLKNVAGPSRDKLYAAVRSIIWLKQFSELPFIHFIAQFTSIISDSYTCPYSNAQADYPVFAQIMQEPHSIPKEVLEALFLFPQRNALRNGGLDTESENAVHEFMQKSAGNISMMQMFISTVPVKTIGRIIFGDYDWQVSESGGGEDWFRKFKEEWKVIFDMRWKNWQRDKKKAQLTDVLNTNFGLQSFPEVPYRPWTRLWGGLPFNCEMTGGFLCWFAENQFNECMATLNVVVLEGIFLKKENRTELSEAINDFVDANQQMIVFSASLKPEGSIGSTFQKLIDDRVRTLKGQNMIDAVILNSEVTVRSCGKMFCDATRVIEKIFHGILDEEKDKDYDSLQNLMTLKGHDNRKFRDSMAEVRTKLNVARSILAEIEPLDLPVEN